MHKTARHVIYWIFIYILWIYLKSYGHPSIFFALTNVVYVLVFMFVFYVMRRIQIPLYYNEGKTGQFVLSILISSMIALGLWHLMMSTLLSAIGQPQSTMIPDKFGSYVLEVIQFYSPTFGLLVWESFLDRKAEQEQIDRLEKENVSNELKYLKAQIDPHFLINSLKSIKAKVVAKHPEAPEMIMQLSGVLDYVLYRGQNQSISLKEELKAINEFITLERQRSTQIKEIKFSANLESNETISPLILLSFIQDVFKSIDDTQVIERIDIQIAVESRKVKTVIEITGLSSKNLSISNLDHLKRQIEILYKNNYNLESKQNNNNVTIDLILPLNE